VRPPKLALRMAAGSIAVAATLALGVAGAAAAPNPGFGTPHASLGVGALTNLAPTMNQPFEQAEDGPQTANVPTLAWVGEDVRLVACDDAIAPNPLGLGSIDFQQANWSSGAGNDLWTGDQASAPAFDSTGSTNLAVTNTSSAFFFAPDGVDNTSRISKGCVSADISSVHAGLDEVSVNVTDEGISRQGIVVDPQVVYSEQFIVIWMTANTPKITEASTTSLSYPTTAGDNGTPSPTSQLTTTGLTNLAAFLGDGSTPGTFASLDQWTMDKRYDCGNFIIGPLVRDHDYNCANDTPAANNGLVQVRVTGSFPIEDQPPATTNANYFKSITGGGNPSSITLPNQWVALANLMAASSTNYQGTNGSLWDIHGSPTNTLAVQGHAGDGPAVTGPGGHPAGLCQYDGTLFDQTTDVVDDCLSTGGTNPTGNPFEFSRVFGDVTTVGNTIGPYDDEAPSATLLSDGNLNTDDAPMPALPVTVTIGKGGIGGLYGVSKWLIYSHDFDGSAASPLSLPTPTSALTSTGTANLYNPYYQEYIPSTQRPINEASGITGVYNGGGAASSGDDFPGFSDGHTSPYTFWTALDASSTDTTPVSNGCLEFDSTIDGGTTQEFGRQNPWDASGIVEGTTPVTRDGHTINVPNGLFYYGTPDYPTSVVVYTDERGEAYVDYNPGNGWYNNIAADGNGACDLQGLYGKAIGTSSISATANYPYESVPYGPIGASNTLVKTVDSEWSKTLTAYPKSNLSGNNISVVVAHAQNVNGEPFSGEEVCVQAPANESVSFDDENPLTVTTPPISTTGSSQVGATTLNNYDCGITGTAGNVAFDVSGSNNPTNVDVQALFVAEHIYRDVNIPVLGQSGSVSSTSPPGVLPGDPINTTIQQGASGAAGGSSTGTTTTTSSPSGTPAITPSVVVKGNVCKVQSVHLRSKRGKFSVSFKLSCATAKSASVTIKAFKANGKLLHTYKLAVKTNKAVTVSLSGKVHRVTVVA
jgi:hypothetical protein